MSQSTGDSVGLLFFFQPTWGAYIPVCAKTQETKNFILKFGF